MTTIRTLVRAVTVVATCAGPLVCCAGAVLWVSALAHPLAAQAPPATPDSAKARGSHTAQPERPTVATHAGTVSPGWVEFEVGLEADNGPGDASNHITTIVTKFGVASHTQLSLYVNGSTPDGGRTGIGDIGVGLKWRVLDNHPLLGDFAIQPTLKFPTGSTSRGTGTGTTDASLLLISSRDIGPVHVDLNAGFTARSGDGSLAPTSQGSWTVSFGGLVTGSVGWVAELYGYPGTGGKSGAPPLVGLLFGPTLAVRDWLVLDAGAIAPVAGHQPHAVYLGATYNVGRIF